MIDDIYPSIISISIYLSIYLSTASTLRLSSEILLPADEVAGKRVNAAEFIPPYLSMAIITYTREPHACRRLTLSSRVVAPSLGLRPNHPSKPHTCAAARSASRAPRAPRGPSRACARTRRGSGSTPGK